MSNRIKILILGAIALICTVLGIVSLNQKDEDVSVIQKGEYTVKEYNASNKTNPEEESGLNEITHLSDEGANLDQDIPKATSDANSTGKGGAMIESAKPTMEEPKEIMVHICGEVNSPGVYAFHEGDRIVDAVNRAGGLTEAADEAYVNQAGFLVDAGRVYIPSIEESKAMPTPSTDVAPSERNSLVLNESGSSLVNINLATKEELMTLPGVGQSKAESIISYRNEHGGFSVIEDIMNITGIKEGLFGKLKDHITV